MYHARLSPSGSHRWRSCPGSVRMEEPFPDTSTRAADEGTAAHKLAEVLFSGIIEGEPQQAKEYLGRVITLPSGTTWTVDEEMVDGVQLFVDTCLGLAGDDAFHSELWVSLLPLAERAGVEGLDGGTADFMCYKANEDKLIVADLKYGRGVMVDVVENSQAMLYGLGALIALLLNDVQVATVETVIVQPRIDHPDGKVRSATYTFEEMELFSREILTAAQETQRPDAPLVPGSKQCRFCKAKAVCPALADETTALVQAEFPVIAESEERQLPHPEHLTDEQLAAILQAGPLIRDFLSAVSEYVTDTLKQGGEFPGYKLVEGRRSRSWDDAAAAEKYLRRKLGAGNSFKKELISPAQAEKALKKTEGKIPDRLADLIRTNPGGVSLAPESSHKPAIDKQAEAENSFPVITQEET